MLEHATTGDKTIQITTSFTLHDTRSGEMHCRKMLQHFVKRFKMLLNAMLQNATKCPKMMQTATAYL